jgi:hypothetical protein
MGDTTGGHCAGWQNLLPGKGGPARFIASDDISRFWRI